jgi:hypothetical protein|tara:strand:- start:216 stop:356 length:141 start_codon:yes stop_codon:yes gene_type:complete
MMEVILQQVDMVDLVVEVQTQQVQMVILNQVELVELEKQIVLQIHV